MAYRNCLYTILGVVSNLTVPNIHLQPPNAFTSFGHYCMNSLTNSLTSTNHPLIPCTSTRHKRLMHRPSFLLLPEFLRQVISLALIITSTFQHNESVSSSCIQCHDGSNVLLSTPCIISTSLSIRRTAFCSMHSTRRSNILLNCTSCIRWRHTIY